MTGNSPVDVFVISLTTILAVALLPLFLILLIILHRHRPPHSSPIILACVYIPILPQVAAHSEACAASHQAEGVRSKRPFFHFSLALFKEDEQKTGAGAGLGGGIKDPATKVA